MSLDDMKRTIRCGRPRKGEEGIRRDQLLDQAMQLFAVHGYGNVSLETIAREARVSLRTIYCQFGGKAALFGAVIRRVSDEFEAGLPSGDDLARPMEEILVEFGRFYLRRICLPECIHLRSQILAEAHRFPELAAEFYSNGPERAVLCLTEFFSTRQPTASLAEEDCRFLAGQFMNSLRGERFLRLQLGLEEPPTEEEAEAWVRRVVRLFLRGCLKPEG